MKHHLYDSVSLWKARLLEGLEEDGSQWDWSSISVTGATGTQPVRACVVAKSDGLWAAEGLVRTVGAVSSELGDPIEVTSSIENAKHFKPGMTLCEWRGLPRSVLAFERPFLNLASYVCGIATQTRNLVDQVEKLDVKPTPRITLTRKTLPGYRDIAIHGVRVGGGFPHRVSLSGGVLLKENHIAIAGGISHAVLAAQATAPHSLRIEIEVRNLEELKEALAARVDAVLLDNFSPSQVKEALTLISRALPKPIVEISGGITAASISQYAQAGVDVLSVGALTHSVRTADLSLLIQ